MITCHDGLQEGGAAGAAARQRMEQQQQQQQQQQQSIWRPLPLPFGEPTAYLKHLAPWLEVGRERKGHLQLQQKQVALRLLGPMCVPRMMAVHSVRM